MAARLPSAIPYGIAKKVSVARALMSGPTLLLLDEPASGLDEAELEDFARLIVELRSTMACYSSNTTWNSSCRWSIDSSY